MLDQEKGPEDLGIEQLKKTLRSTIDFLNKLNVDEINKILPPEIIQHFNCLRKSISHIFPHYLFEKLLALDTNPSVINRGYAKSTNALVKMNIESLQAVLAFCIQSATLLKEKDERIKEFAEKVEELELRINVNSAVEDLGIDPLSAASPGNLNASDVDNSNIIPMRGHSNIDSSDGEATQEVDDFTLDLDQIVPLDVVEDAGNDFGLNLDEITMEKESEYIEINFDLDEITGDEEGENFVTEVDARMFRGLYDLNKKDILMLDEDKRPKNLEEMRIYLGLDSVNISDNGATDALTKSLFLDDVEEAETQAGDKNSQAEEGEAKFQSKLRDQDEEESES